MAKYVRILSVDGGGIKGIVPAQVLMSLEEKLRIKSGDQSARVADYFDLIAGTSTGGIIAGALLLPDSSGRPKYTAQKIRDLYLNRGPEIFHISLGHRIRSLFGLIDEKYPSKGIEKVLQEYFEDKTLKDLVKPSLITAYEFEKQKPFFFTSVEAQSDESRNFFMTDVCRSTSAAPTYFQASKIPNIAGSEKLAFVDGGVFANNPAMCAFVEAYKKYQSGDGKPATAENMVIFSLGTGYQKEKGYKYKQVKDWGLAQWIRPVFSILMESNSETVDYELMKIFETVNLKQDDETPQQYFRIDPDLSDEPKSIMELDNVRPENLQRLQEIGEKAAKENDAALDRVVELLFAEEPATAWEVNNG